MKGRRGRWWLVGVAAGLLVVPAAARADDAPCIAASENEVALRKQDKLQDALKQLVICAAPSCSTEVQTECRRRLADVKAAIPTVVLRATDTAGNDLVAVDVTLDGVALTSTLNGHALPVDPGSHVLRFTAAGKPTVEKTVVFAEGEKDRRVVVAIGEAEAVVPAPVPVPVVVEPPRPPPPRTGPLYITGFIVGGAGVATVVVGAVFGGLAFSKWSSAEKDCNGTGGSCAGNSNPNAASTSRSAGTFADVSTATFIVGGALLATGVTLVLLGRPKSSATALSWSPAPIAHGGGLGLSGAW